MYKIFDRGHINLNNQSGPAKKAKSGRPLALWAWAAAALSRRASAAGRGAGQRSHLPVQYSSRKSKDPMGHGIASLLGI